MRRSLGSVPLITTAILLVAAPVALPAQVVITVQGGVHLGGVEPPTQSLQQATGGRATGARGVTGEATTAGTRIGIGISRDCILDGGLAWSHSSSRSATVGQPTPPIGPRTLFASSTIRT